ncbi:MAG: hypothetical protein AAGD14_16040 [Planctomycetota bacterium]
MPAEQRVITAGFVALGLGVLGVIAFYILPSTTVTDTIDTIKNELYPAYKRSESERNYPRWTQDAQAILKALDEGGRNVIEKNLQAQATDRIKDAQNIYEMVKNGVVDKVAEGQYPYGDEFFARETHRALTGLEKALEGDTDVLAKARRLSKKVNEALVDARLGSGQPLPTPPAFDVKEKMPGIKPNPILEHDAAAFAVFGLSPELLTGALQTPNPGGRATPARLRWNKNMPKSTISEDLAALVIDINGLLQLSARLKPLIEDVEKQAAGSPAAKKLYDKALDKLARGLPVKTAQALRENREQFLDGKVLLALIQAEGELFAGPRTTLEALSKAFQGQFP